MDEKPWDLPPREHRRVALIIILGALAFVGIVVGIFVVLIVGFAQK
jgi:hypothetical protein